MWGVQSRQVTLRNLPQTKGKLPMAVKAPLTKCRTVWVLTNYFSFFSCAWKLSSTFVSCSNEPVNWYNSWYCLSTCHAWQGLLACKAKMFIFLPHSKQAAELKVPVRSSWRVACSLKRLWFALFYFSFPCLFSAQHFLYSQCERLVIIYSLKYKRCSKVRYSTLKLFVVLSSLLTPKC